MNHIELELQALQIMESQPDVENALKLITEFLHSRVEHYDWVGFYFMNHQQRKLHLGPYTGAETDHTEIPFGKGICGQVAESGEVFTVEDVSQQDNYIACSIDVKSEIVVPLYLDKENMIGQIDIDSHKKGAFQYGDQFFLKDLCFMLAKHYGPALKEYAAKVAG